VPAAPVPSAKVFLLLRRLHDASLRAGWAIGLLLLALAWLVASGTGAIGADVVPPLSAVVARFAGDLGSPATWRQVGITARAWFLAVPLGFVAGVFIAAVCATSPKVFRALQPYLVLANAIPRVVLAPVFILALGLGTASRVALSVSLILFPTILGVYGGLRLCDPALLASVELFGGDRRALWRHVRLPAALPYLVANWRLATNLGLLGAIVGEILIAPNGIGWIIRTRAGIFDVAGVFSALLIILALALLVNVVTDRVSRRLLRWQ
jgi:NitT/TauT family transport system permease protein